MPKLIAMGSLTLLGLLAGLLINMEYRAVYRELSSLQDALADMVNVIRHAPLDLADILLIYSSERYEPFCRVFGELRRAIVSGAAPVAEIWKDAVTSARLSVKGDDLDEVIGVGSVFEIPSRERMIASLEVAASRVQALAEQAQKALDEKGTMAKRLSLAAGLFCAILIW